MVDPNVSNDSNVYWLRDIWNLAKTQLFGEEPEHNFFLYFKNASLWLKVYLLPLVVRNFVKKLIWKKNYVYVCLYKFMSSINNLISLIKIL